jgi:hypothetical protein
MRRPFAGILLILVLIVGGGLIAATAYQAGLSTAVATVVQAPVDGSTGTAVTPVVVPGYGYGYGWHGFAWGPGFGFLGFLGTLLFIILVVGLLRAAFGAGRGRRGWDGPGGRGPAGPGGGPWESRAHDTFEDWHRRAHEGSAPATRTTEGAGTRVPDADAPTQR